MSVRLNGSTSGYTELDASAEAGNNTIKLPASNGSSYQVLRNGATPGTTEFADQIVSATAKAYNWNGSTTNTSIDFTGIPAWAKRVTLLLAGVSTTGTSYMLVQIGSSTGLVTTNYNGTSSVVTTAVEPYSSTIGFPIRDNPFAGRVNSGHFTLVLLSGNIWVSSHVIKSTTGTTCLGAGDVTLPGTLDRIRITTVNGTDTFDAGSINILYE